MNNCQLASSGLAFTNSNSIVQGNFSKPDTVLDTIRLSKPTAEGVIVITGKHVSGRIGVANNCVIVGAIVDGTGETGLGAVYKLLLVPSGTFNFRTLLPQEQWHMQQHLNMHSHEAKSSLAGPSSIGLARPADTSLTKLPSLLPSVPNLPVVNVPDSSAKHATTANESLSHTNSAAGTIAIGSPTFVDNSISKHNNEEVYEEYVGSIRTIKINNYEQTITKTFVADCNKLLEQVEKKPTGELMRSTRTTDPNLRALRVTDPKLRAVKEAPETSDSASKPKTLSPIASLALVAGALGVIGLVGFMGHSGKPASPAQQLDSTAAFMASADAQRNQASMSSDDLRITSKSDTTSPDLEATVVKQSPIFTIANSKSEQPTPDHTTFILPGAGPIHSTAPGIDPAQSESSNEKSATLDRLIEKNKVVETENMSFWVQAVKNNPNDAVAREHLAYKLLANGQPKVSVQQFQAMMVLRQPSCEEVSKYVDALVLYDQKQLAQQLLAYVLTVDPSKDALRQKLQAMQ